jgi:rhomboid protease GluP
MSVECPHCRARVIPRPDGRCPACGEETGAARREGPSSAEEWGPGESQIVVQPGPPGKSAGGGAPASAGERFPVIVVQTGPSPQGEIREFGRSLAALTPNAWVTPAIVGINVLVFLAMLVGGVHLLDPEVVSLVAWGANFGPLTLGGEWWRLLTCMFLHVGLIHLAVNMWVLWAAGRFVERLFGNAGFLVLYLLSGLAGSLGTLYWHPDVVSAGASGAIFGVVGALMGFLARRRHSIPPRLLKGLGNSFGTFLVLNLLLGLTVPGIDMAAHVGGLVGGFLCGLALSLPITSQARSRRAARNVLVAVVGAALVVLAALAVPEPASRAATYVRQGAACFDSGEYDKAIAACNEAIRLDPSLADAYAVRGAAYAKKRQFDRAIDDCTEAIRLDPDLAIAYYYRGRAYVYEGETEKAKQDLEKARQMEPGLFDASR